MDSRASIETGQLSSKNKERVLKCCHNTCWCDWLLARDRPYALAGCNMYDTTRMVDGENRLSELFNCLCFRAQALEYLLLHFPSLHLRVSALYIHTMKLFSRTDKLTSNKMPGKTMSSVSQGAEMKFHSLCPYPFIKLQDNSISLNIWGVIIVNVFMTNCLSMID